MAVHATRTCRRWQVPKVTMVGRARGSRLEGDVAQRMYLPGGIRFKSRGTHHPSFVVYIKKWRPGQSHMDRWIKLGIPRPPGFISTEMREKLRTHIGQSLAIRIGGRRRNAGDFDGYQATTVSTVLITNDHVEIVVALLFHGIDEGANPYIALLIDRSAGIGQFGNPERPHVLIRS